ncbi:MAG: hypothetical protein V4525_10940 [Pseudomonadota bacterium]
MMNIAYYLHRIYPYPPCWQLVAEVYERELGFVLPVYKELHEEKRYSRAKAFQLAIHQGDHGLHKVLTPEDYSVVLMGSRRPVHAGIFYQGRILHATDSGVSYQDIWSIKDSYAWIEYWAKS